MLPWQTNRTDTGARLAKACSFLKGRKTGQAYTLAPLPWGMMRRVHSGFPQAPRERGEAAMYELIAEGHFDSAHFLHGYDGKCENLHGHRWRVVATFGADSLVEDGDMRDMVVDFSVVKGAVAEVCDSLDHTLLVEEGTLAPATVAALEAETFSLTVLPFRTTAENLARHVFGELRAMGLPVAAVEVDETPNNRAVFRP